MDARDEKKVEELFEIAAHLSLSEREAFFERHCANEPHVRAELESLLEHDDEETKGYLKSPVIASGDREATRSWPVDGGLKEADLPKGGDSEQSPERVGKYLVRRKIGEGGMGAVYLAEQRQPVRRDVAIKLIKHGLDSDEVLARFDREREALELMDHPGVSRILDAGTTDGGRPYFVMEYTPGPPIDRYCDEHGLDVAARLELLGQVCDAVQYAHQKGVIHRDLKPGNVLVTEHESGPRIKVIDFGIAVAGPGVSAMKDRPTEARQVVGTRHYMSPEQATPGGGDVDTRSDVYSLGVMLYDLLVGVLPFDAAEQPTTKEATPVPPSRRFSRLGHASTRIAEERSTSVRAHVRRLSGDLDWITIKAMEREPARRYATASELGADIRRHLDFKPVLAGPPEWRYVMFKFLRRHRAIVAAVSLAFLALIVGSMGLAWGILEASKQRDDAIASGKRALEAEALAKTELGRTERALDEAEAAKAARERALDIAEKRSADAQAVTDFLVETVALADLEVSLSPDLSLGGMLRRAGERVGNAFANYPEGEVAVRGALGRAFHSMGGLDDAEEHLQRALDLETGLLTTPPLEVYTTMTRLSQVYGDSDSREDTRLRGRAHELALSLIENASAPLAERWRILNEDAFLATIDKTRDSLAELSLAAEMELEFDSPIWLVLADSLEYLSDQLVGRGEMASAVLLLEEVLRIRREQMPSIHPVIAHTLGSLVDALNQDGRSVRAEELVRESIGIYKAALGADHWLVDEARSLLGETLSYQGVGGRAEELLVRGHEAILAARGLASRAGVISAHRLVNHYTLYGDPDSADMYRGELAEALANSKNSPWRWGIEVEAYGPEHVGLLFALSELGRVLYHTGDPESEYPDLELYEDALDTIRLEWEISTDLDSPISLITARWLANFPFFPGKIDADLVRRLQGRMLDVLIPHQDRFLRSVVYCWIDLHRFASLEGDHEQAEDCLQRALEATTEIPGRPTDLRIYVERQLLDYYASRGRFEEAESTLLATWEESAAFFGLSHRRTLSAMDSLLRLYDRWGSPLRAAPCLRRHLSGRSAADLDAARLQDLVWFIVRSEGFEPALYELALAAAERMRELQRDEEASRSFVGMAHCRLGRFEEAERELESCPRLIEEGVLRHGAFRALVRIGQGRIEEAAQLLERLGGLNDEATSREERRILAEAHARLERGN